MIVIDSDIVKIGFVLLKFIFLKVREKFYEVYVFLILEENWSF